MVKTNLLILFLVLGLTNCSVSQDTIDLFIWAGQSNAQGWQGDAEYYPSAPDNLDSQIRLNYTFIGSTRSHGWASGPTAWLTVHVLGISVTDNGNAVKVAPNLGDLTWVEGSFPTKHGGLHVRHEKNEDGSISTEIQKPDGLIVE
jgi:hypothetical protein